jgi:hypothetical protein
MAIKKSTKKAVPPEAKLISHRIHRKTLEELDALAKQSGMVRSSLINLAIARLLKQGV